MSLVRRRVIVAGRVQGVFFRASVRERARAHGVSGWVRNLPDGRVEAAFEGRPGDVERLERFARVGPQGARVDSVEARDEEPEGTRAFEIR